MEQAVRYGLTLGDLFNEVAARNAQAVALRYPDGGEVTYGELWECTTRIATALIRQGIKPRQVVCLINHKSLNGLASILACNMLGVLYTNLDPESPAERAMRILDQCSPELILIDGTDRDAYDNIIGDRQESIRTMEELSVYETDQNAIDGFLRDAQLTGKDGAYIMFTSGSTGFPKGAVITQDNLLRFIAWGRSRFGIGPGEVMTNVNPIYFDNSVFDLYTALYSGATLVPFNSDHVKDARQLVQQVDDAGCTFWFSVPSMLVYLLVMRAVEERSFPAMKRIMFGGEGFPKARLKELFDLIGDRVQLVNAYGPTECTCICSAYNISPKDFDDMDRLAPLGRLIPGFYLIIDPLSENDPDMGELLLGGPHVGSGYFNSPERTKGAFVQDPTEPNYRKVVYRTGDVVHQDDLGRLHFKGRVDNQIKHMGYRIELEEVESAFSAIDKVKEVGVVYHKHPVTSAGSIQAFVHVDDLLEEPELRDRLQQRLPAYMMPKQIHFLSELPKNANGKIDRRQLKEKCA